MKPKEIFTEDVPKFTILVVDDNEDILEFLADDLGEKYVVLTAIHAHAALQQLETHIVHLIISDIMMPGMDGLEFCDYVKAHFELSHIPIILLTARNTLQSKIEGLTAGADAYIEKPFSPEHLNAQVASLLSNRMKLKDYFAQSPLAHIRTMAHTKMDEQFLEKLQQLIEADLPNTQLDVEFLAQQLNMSRPTLYRKIKSISNLSPNEMINLTRLKKAAALISEGHHRMNEVAESVGYSSLTQFGRNFHKQFGMTPTEYARKL
ncbi:response regulator [Niabella drilacis]|uniref:DNA-binding response regulator, OmpR family, contains REC and winged-helix (WHTH) domain n=1 Tax=Niabella drilacis (strain DSM 25811 / CCM 8410 / CCUG 62505 / LMG 26954 / E90) TaxID=1285928 RepID=A0A1G6TWZ4_NIADE|nr:response regulator [Niabella drilacis]SDD33630.1 DNA-binding response regulator, OmpR family, contains REC and winged-helix (wHTH) domain [Niabella drilacis]